MTATIKSSRELFDVLAVITEGHPGKLRLAALGELRAVLRRDWDARVLDAWSLIGARSWQCHQSDGWRFACTLTAPLRSENTYRASTEDAARHAAAQAVYPTLSAEEQARIGACP